MATFVAASKHLGGQAISWRGWGATLAVGASLWAVLIWTIVR